MSEFKFEFMVLGNLLVMANAERQLRSLKGINLL